MNLGLLVRMDKHQGITYHKGNICHKNYTLKNWNTYVKLCIGFSTWVTDQHHKRTDELALSFSLKKSDFYLFVSFETGSSQADTDILDFKAQRLQTDSALENISGDYDDDDNYDDNDNDIRVEEVWGRGHVQI